MPRILTYIWFVCAAIAFALFLAAPASAQVAPSQPTPGQVTATTTPRTTSGPVGPQGQPGPAETGDNASVSINLGKTLGSPSQSVTVILLLTVLAVAPALLIMTTSFTRIVIVLSLTRNALGIQNIPPNQVLVGLSLFLSLFIMGPTLAQMNSAGLQPYLKGQMTQEQAYNSGVKPLRTFMLKHSRKAELGLFIKASGGKRPSKPSDVSMSALVPAFIVSEIKTAFIIGFIIFIPFLVIDLIVSSSLMSMGMMMLPPVMVSLPFKLLLFVLVDGWALVVRSLIQSFN